MGQITIQIGGRGYPLACRDGEEKHLIDLAAMLDGKAGELNTTLGAMSESRLLLMAGILIADELFDSRKAGSPAAAAPLDGARVTALAQRLEALAETLETNGASGT